MQRIVFQFLVGGILCALAQAPLAQAQSATPTAQQAQTLVEGFLKNQAYSGIDENGDPCDVKIYKSAQNLWVVIQGGQKLLEEFVFRYRADQDPLTVAEKSADRARLRVQSSRKNYFETLFISLPNQQVEVTVSERSGSAQASKSCVVVGP